MRSEREGRYLGGNERVTFRLMGTFLLENSTTSSAGVKVDLTGSVSDQRARYIDHVVSVTELEDKRIEMFRSKHRVVGDRSFKLAVLKGRGQLPSAYSQGDSATLGFV